MAELNVSAVESFMETVRNGADEAASAFERTFDAKITIRPGEGGSYQAGVLGSKLAGKGLALVLFVDGQGVAILIPDSTGLVPAWCDHPDATGKSKLSTFAQEWGMNLIPEDFFPEDFQAGVVGDLPKALIRAELALDAAVLEIVVERPDGETPSVYMLWPLAAPEKLLQEESAPDLAAPLPGPPTFGHEAPVFIGQGAAGFDPFGSEHFGQNRPKRRSLDDLPGYSRSVLKVRIPVAAVLARARKPIKSILELGVGSVIQFDKSCDELLEVEVGQSVVIATAEAVKIGDKFGFRVHTILLPDERFRKVEVRREGEYRLRQDAPQIIGKAPIKSFEKH